jgi:hypothetical protein
VETSASIQCPYCGQGFEIAIDPSVARQQFVTDCEICCRPLSVTFVIGDGEVSVDVAAA